MAVARDASPSHDEAMRDSVRNRPRLGLPAGALALIGVATCAFIWGTTWYVITFQLGTVDPIASVAARFGLAAVVLFGVCLVMRRSLRMSRAAHLACLGQGLFVFAIDYAFVYWAEERVASAVVAVIFAALAICNLVLFRWVLGQRASRGAWMGAGLGVVGVGVLSAGELLRADLAPTAWAGVAFALIAVAAAAIGNVFAFRAEKGGAAVMPATAWAMAYGTGFLLIYGLATGVNFTLSAEPGYLFALAYLAILGSVVAFIIYFTVARSGGYALASYISAMTPPIAMVVSVLFEGAQFGLAAFAGLGLVLAGQVLLIRSRRPG